MANQYKHTDPYLRNADGSLVYGENGNAALKPDLPDNPTLVDRLKLVEREIAPDVHGFLNSIAGAWPGVRLNRQPKKEGQNVGDLKFDAYGRLFGGSGTPKPDAYDTGEQIDMGSGEGYGGLFNASTILPGLARGVVRLGAKALAGKQLTQALEASSGAAKALTPKAGQEALTGVQALEQANQAGKDVLSAQKSIVGAKTIGQSIDPLVTAGGNAFKTRLAATGGLGVINALGDKAGAAVDAEDAAKKQLVDVPVDIPEPTLGDVTEVPNTFTGRVKGSPAEQLQEILAGNKGLTPYKRPEKHGVAKFFDWTERNLDGARSEENDQAAAQKDYELQMLQRGYLDPETQFKLQQLGLDTGSERNINERKSLKSSGQEFGQRYAPAMDTKSLEELYGLPAGSIDQGALRRMGTEKQLDPMTLLMMQLLAGNGQSLGQGGGTQPPRQLNIPGQTKTK